jgi:hypothetical protein
LPSSVGFFASKGLVSLVVEVVTRFGDGIEDCSRLVNDLDGEVFSIPGVDSPDFTTESHSVGTVVDISLLVGSPEAVSFSTLVVTSVINSTLAGLSRGTTVALPKRAWVVNTFIWVSNRWCSTIIEVHLELKLSETNRFVIDALVKCVGDCDSNVTIRSLIWSFEVDIDVSIIPTARSFAMDSSSSLVSDVFLFSEDITLGVDHSDMDSLSIP